MADQEDAEAKTEAPSARRLQSAWDEGQVPVGATWWPPPAC